MGNEFGHPEWIDFPREGNGWSFHYCRRQWSLKENGFLKYQWLNDFDHDMVEVTKENGMFNQRMADLLLMKAPEQTCAFYRNSLLFVFNFHATGSLENVLIPVPQPGEYTVVLSSDDPRYGGFGNVKMQTYATKEFDGKHYVELYIPARTCFVLKENVIPAEAPKKKRSTRKTTKAAETAEAPKKRTRKTAEVVESAEPAETPKKKRTRKVAEVAESAEPAEAPKKKRTRKVAEKTENE
jgi:1,4-alpha-glucan branching enzyme